MRIIHCIQQLLKELGNPPLQSPICERSAFYEGFKEKEGRVIRWIECVQSYQNEEGKWREKNQGTICKYNPRDWWAVYNEGNRAVI